MIIHDFVAISLLLRHQNNLAEAKKNQKIVKNIFTKSQYQQKVNLLIKKSLQLK